MVVWILGVLARVSDQFLECLLLANEFNQLWCSCTAHVDATFFFEKKVFNGAALLLTEDLIDLTSRDIAHIVSKRRPKVSSSLKFRGILIMIRNYF